MSKENVIQTDLMILGGGPAGTAAAREAGRLGASVTLITEENPGGRARWHSLLPSKVWLNAANLLGELDHSEILGVPHALDQAGAAHIIERIAEIKDRQYSNEIAELKRFNVDIVHGTGRFLDNNTVEVTAEDDGSQKFSADTICIASGSVPIFPPDLKPDGDRILAPRFLSKFDTVPNSMIVVGGGVTGSEIIYLYNQLGTEVTVVTDIPELLPRADTDISRALETVLKERNVTFQKNTAATAITNEGDSVTVSLDSGKELTAEYAFVAIGRKPDVNRLGLDQTDIELSSEQGIRIRETGQTPVDHIYAAGDVTGAPMVANRAMAQGRIAARNAINGTSEEFIPEWNVEAIYTEPEVAQVGLRESGVNDDVSYTVKRISYQGNLKSEITEHREGFLKLLLGNSSEVILGAAAVGYHASDLLTPIAVAIRAELTYEELQQVSPANPTLSELIVSPGY